MVFNLWHLRKSNNNDDDDDDDNNNNNNEAISCIPWHAGYDSIGF